jgi:hypothetical protein
LLHSALSFISQTKLIQFDIRYNRLHSIAVDADFVQAVSAAYPDFAVVRMSSMKIFLARMLHLADTQHLQPI